MSPVHGETEHDLLVRIDERVMTIQKWMVEKSKEDKARDEAISGLRLSRAKVVGGFAVASTVGTMAGALLIKLAGLLPAVTAAAH